MLFLFQQPQSRCLKNQQLLLEPKDFVQGFGLPIAKLNEMQVINSEVSNIMLKCISAACTFAVLGIEFRGAKIIKTLKYLFAPIFFSVFVFSVDSVLV